MHVYSVMLLFPFMQNNAHACMGFVLENLNGDPFILKNQSLISLFHNLRTESKEMLIK